MKMNISIWKTTQSLGKHGPPCESLGNLKKWPESWSTSVALGSLGDPGCLGNDFRPGKPGQNSRKSRNFPKSWVSHRIPCASLGISEVPWDFPEAFLAPPYTCFESPLNFPEFLWIFIGHPLNFPISPETAWKGSGLQELRYPTYIGTRWFFSMTYCAILSEWNLSSLSNSISL